MIFFTAASAPQLKLKGFNGKTKPLALTSRYFTHTNFIKAFVIWERLSVHTEIPGETKPNNEMLIVCYIFCITMYMQ